MNPPQHSNFAARIQRRNGMELAACGVVILSAAGFGLLHRAELGVATALGFLPLLGGGAAFSTGVSLDRPVASSVLLMLIGVGVVVSGVNLLAAHRMQRAQPV